MPDTRETRLRLGKLGLGAAARTATLAVMLATTLPATAQIQPMPGDTPSSKVAAPLAADPALEARVMDIANELRCLVCQNETIAASHADLAVDLRKQIRVKLVEGQSERQILDFMVARYGDFVLYRPPLKASTVLLWAGPFALLLVAGFVLAVNIRRRRRAAAQPELSPAEAQRARALLDQVPPKSP
jgi:cytochrome c-type biogenesis protein CcmH